VQFLSRHATLITWITSALKKNSRVKNLLYRKWAKTRNVADEMQYKNYRKIFRQVAREAEVNYYKGLFDFRSNSTKKIWSNLNHVCSFKKSNRNSISIQKLIVSGKEITDVQDIAEELNNYFSNLGQNLVKELFKNNPHHSSDSYKWLSIIPKIVLD